MFLCSLPPSEPQRGPYMDIMAPRGDGPPDVQGLELKLGALLVLLSSTLLFGFGPLCLFRGAACSLQPETRHRALSLLSCFAGGVFLATCLLDLLPDYLEGARQAFTALGVTLQFPLPEFIMAMGFFLVLVLEQIVLAFKDFKDPPPLVRTRSEDRRPLLVDPGVQSGDWNVRRHSHSHHQGAEEEEEAGHFHVDFLTRSGLRAFILVFSLSLHSVFEGLAVGLLEDEGEVLEICVALVLHKSIISFSLALQLAQAGLQRPLVAGCLLLFACMSPLGVGLGLALTEMRASGGHRLARSVLEGVATGTFIYITFMEILPHELANPRFRLPKVAALLLGFGLVTAVLFIKL